jgi:hypothetical protein
MSIECYNDDCPFHRGDEPFCDEIECRILSNVSTTTNYGGSECIISKEPLVE